MTGCYAWCTVRLTGESIAGSGDGPWVANPADATPFEPEPTPGDDDTTTPSSGGGGSSSLGWIVVGLLGLGLLFRRKRS